MKRLLLSAVAALALAIAPSVAQAHHYARHGYVHHYRTHYRHRAYGHRYRAEPRSETDQGFEGNFGNDFGFLSPPSRQWQDTWRGHDRLGIMEHYRGRDVVGGRPAGCPHAYCGCGTSLYFFGRIVDGLNLAANWLRFPRTSPHDGVAAVAPNRHHVLAVMKVLGPGRYLVHNSNGAHGLTTNFVTSLRGYTFVEPRG